MGGMAVHRRRCRGDEDGHGGALWPVIAGRSGNGVPQMWVPPTHKLGNVLPLPFHRGPGRPHGRHDGAPAPVSRRRRRSRRARRGVIAGRSGNGVPQIWVAPTHELGNVLPLSFQRGPGSLNLGYCGAPASVSRGQSGNGVPKIWVAPTHKLGTVLPPPFRAGRSARMEDTATRR